jgi:dTDP-4-amino-4,6-dideoxygalactose transaminase
MEAAFRDLTGRRHAIAMGSGRMAIALLLQALAEGDARDRVVVPGWTCFTVAAAIARAGLKVQPVDSDPRTLDFDYDALARIDWTRVLAVIPSSLLGFPADLPRLERLCAEKRAHLIDDAAQCLGASVGGRAAGTFGVAGIYSLGRGKNLAAMGGGVLVTDDDALAEKLRAGTAGLRVATDGASLARSLVYSIALHPTLYGAATRFVEVGASRFDPRFDVSLPSGYKRRLAAGLLPRLADLTAARIEAAGHYGELLADLGGIETTVPHPGATTVYLRYPVRVAPAARGRVFPLLARSGLGAAVMYPEPVHRIPGIAAHLAGGADDLPGADRLARSLFTLPTHPYVTARHRERIAHILRANLRAE